MGTRGRCLKLGVALQSLALAGLATPAFAAIAPADPALISPASNGDYVNHVTVPDEEQTINGRLFTKGISDELKLRYNQLYKEYESNKNYGLNSMDTELRYQDANKSLGSWAMHRILDEDIRTPMRRYMWGEVRSTLRKDDSKPDADASGAGAGGVEGGPASASGAAVMSAPSSSSFTFQNVYGHVETFYNNGLMLDSNTKMRFQYDMPSGVMDLKFTGGIVDTSFDYFVVPLNLSTSGLGNNTNSTEHAALSMNRGFKEIGVSTGMHYGVMTRTLNYGMNKQLVGPLNAAVNQSHGLADSSRDETTYRVSLGLTF